MGINAKSLLCLLMAILLACPAFAFDPRFAECIMKNESNGSPAQTNDWGYTGKYQMGVNYAAENGLCSNAASIPLMGTYQNWSKCNFSGDLANQYNVHSYADFTTGPNASAIQDAIFQRASNKMWNKIVSNGLDKYVGQNIGGVVMTKETMVAMAHLKGYGGLLETLAGGVSKDGNGTSTLGYAACLAKCLSGEGNEKDCKMKIVGACNAAAEEPPPPNPPPV